MEENMKRSLEGKIAVVTGAADGVGFGIAEALTSEGATVVVADLQQDAIDRACARLGGGAWGRATDISKLDQVQALYAQVKEQHGRIDCVIANAGIGDHAVLGSITEQQVDWTFAVNVKGVIFTVQAALPLMPRGGSVVVIGSTASEIPPPGMSVYGASKAAVRTLVRSWVYDAKDLGIRINVLSPGTVNTQSLRRAMTKALGEERGMAAVEAIAGRNPSGRIGEPREIGRATVFLCSDAASYVNGVELFADGGMRAAT
jgi:NAD(P)-dependent dehydrogenase (short-subunit alcohol dehydrogenase family)